MSGEILLRAVQQRHALEAQRSAILSRVESLQSSLADAKSMLSHIDELLLSIAHLIHEAPSEGSRPLAQKKATGNPKKEAIAQEVHAYLRAAGGPLSRSELFSRLADNGFIIHGTNPEMVLSTMLWRTADQFGIERLGSGGYGLKSWRQSSAPGATLGGSTKKGDDIFD